MADKTISQLEIADTILSTDYIIIDNTEVTRRAEVNSLSGLYVANSTTTSAGRTILAATDHQAQITALTNITDTDATTINLTVEDSGKIINCTSQFAVTINMPTTDPDSNFTVAVIQGGLGMVTFEPNGKTLNSYNSLYSIAGQHAWASVTRVAPNTYNLTGTLI